VEVGGNAQFKYIQSLTDGSFFRSTKVSDPTSNEGYSLNLSDDDHCAWLGPGMKRYAALILVALAAVLTNASAQAQQTRAVQVTWEFNNLSKIGGSPVMVEGHPSVISSPVGRAIEFDGKEDALFIDQHPLAGAKTYTWEAIFRPDGGAETQRWFHLAERDPQTGELFKMTGGGATGRGDLNPRLLFELRVTGNSWYLDAFATRGGAGNGRLLLFPEKLHAIGRWYHVAQVYDGAILRSYVNGEIQGEGPLDYQPQGPGATSIGARMNKVDYFRGAIARARFTFEALTPGQFMALPPQ
jgi:hypothetical protein